MYQYLDRNAWEHNQGKYRCRDLGNATRKKGSFLSLLSNDELGRKTGYPNNNNNQRPKFAFMNPELTFTLPEYQTAAGLTDMYAHLLEHFFFAKRKGLARSEVARPFGQGERNRVQARMPIASTNPSRVKGPL
jgi:hypothetical protein